MKQLVGFVVLSILATACVVHDGHRSCREHESWDGNTCHADHGYEHYWDHDDHRDWHADDHHDDDHHDDHH